MNKSASKAKDLKSKTQVTNKSKAKPSSSSSSARAPKAAISPPVSVSVSAMERLLSAEQLGMVNYSLSDLHASSASPSEVKSVVEEMLMDFGLSDEQIACVFAGDATETDSSTQSKVECAEEKKSDKNKSKDAVSKTRQGEKDDGEENKKEESVNGSGSEDTADEDEDEVGCCDIL